MSLSSSSGFRRRRLPGAACRRPASRACLPCLPAMPCLKSPSLPCLPVLQGIIGGLAAYLICKLSTYQLFSHQQRWPGVSLYKRWSSQFSMFMPFPGWNCDCGE